MARSDTKLIQSVPITIGRHTFNIARMPAIVAVQVVEMYAALGVMFQDRPTNGRTYMLAVAKIVKYVLRNLILDEPSFVDRFRLRWAAFTTTKRKILRLPREQFNGLLDAITTVAFGDKKKEIEVQDRAYRAMIKQLGPLTASEFEQLFASLQPSLERIRQGSGKNKPSKK